MDHGTLVETEDRSIASGGTPGTETADVAIRYLVLSTLSGENQRSGPMERKKASDYPQELLDLFHEYQHGEITRREFFDRAGKFAVGGLTVATIFETMRPNYAWAQQVQIPRSRIKTSYETVQSPQG